MKSILLRLSAGLVLLGTSFPFVRASFPESGLQSVILRNAYTRFQDSVRTSFSEKIGMLNAIDHGIYLEKTEEIALLFGALDSAMRSSDRVRSANLRIEIRRSVLDLVKFLRYIEVSEI